MLDQIEKEYGSFYARMVRISPTALRLIEENSPTKIVRLEGSDHGYTDRVRIFIGDDYTPVEFTAILVHELYHLSQPAPNPHQLSRVDFINMMLSEEVQAKCTEIQGLRELYAAGCALTKHHMKLLSIAESELETYLSRHVWSARTSTTHQPYPEYYGDYWDLERRAKAAYSLPQINDK